MKVCNEIKKRIDEADHADQLNIEIGRHTAHCSECRGHAEQRAALRNLLAAGARVSVPVNFDAMLNARLAEVKAQKSFSWLSPAAYMQFGAATAILAVIFFAVQYGNLFSNSNQALQAASVSDFNKNIYDSLARRITPMPATDYDIQESAPKPTQPVRYNAARINRSMPRPTDDYISLNDGGVILVRGQNGEREVTVPTVSIGAQPLLYSSRQPQPTRTSF
jgi:hypothetical protein